MEVAYDNQRTETQDRGTIYIAEQYVEKRDAHTWTTVMDGALAQFPVRIIQSTADQGRPLLKHGRDSLGAHRSPDLFHVLRDLHKATSRPLVKHSDRRPLKLTSRT